MDEEVLDLLVLQAEGQQAAGQRPEVGLDLVARPSRHLRSKSAILSNPARLFENLVALYRLVILNLMPNNSALFSICRNIISIGIYDGSISGVESTWTALYKAKKMKIMVA